MFVTHTSGKTGGVKNDRDGQRALLGSKVGLLRWYSEVLCGGPRANGQALPELLILQHVGPSL
jgi:hypothetical protein